METWTSESAETIELPEQEEQQFAPRVDDTFARLEKGEADKLRAKELNSRVLDLYHDSKAKFKNDYELNKQLRRQNRYEILSDLSMVVWDTPSKADYQFFRKSFLLNGMILITKLKQFYLVLRHFNLVFEARRNINLVRTLFLCINSCPPQ